MKQLGGYKDTVIVVPTRNRAAIAMNAIRSVLEQPVDNIQVLVSDNSTIESERTVLASFCSAQKDPRLRYLRPPQSLSMSSHWEWAMQEALQFYRASHFLYLTDRMMFRTDALTDLLNIAALYPTKIISYNHDRIIDSKQPIRVQQYPASGKLLEVTTERLSYLYSQAVLHLALPRMLNCLVPREILERIRLRFGNIFCSISPDFVFCCRCLDMEDSILFYDKSPIFHYALNRSNGASVTRGEMTPDNADFTSNLPVANSIRNYATPIPQLITAVNAVFNEYFLYQQQTTSSRFFEVNLQKYLNANAEEIAEVVDPSLRAAMLELLISNGYQETDERQNAETPKKGAVERLSSKVNRVVTAPFTTPAWLFMARRFGLRPPGENRFQFDSIEAAIDYSKNISIGNLKKRGSAAYLLQGREIATPSSENDSHNRQRVRRVISSLPPVAVKRIAIEQINEAKAAKLLRLKRRFRQTLKLQTPDNPRFTAGVNLVAYIRGEIGLGTVARGMASALESADVPFNVINIDVGTLFSNTDKSWSHKEVLNSNYDTTIVCVNPDNSTQVKSIVPVEVLGTHYVVGNWFWELPEIPDEWLSDLEFVDEVWAASKFIKDAVSRKASIPVIHMPPVVALNSNMTFSRRDLGLPENRYLFLAMFDSNSVLQRKNPLGVLQAFKSAFAAGDASVGLVMKFNNAQSEQPLFRAVMEAAVDMKNVLIIDRVLSRDEITSLLASCDCFVSLHRSEGFGLGPAEAMSLGKPTIITNWSGNTDYMDADNSIGIDYKLVELGQDFGPYKAYQHWAEPDLEQAAYWMTRISQDRGLGNAIGLRAKETIERSYSPHVIGKLIQDRLTQIRQMPAREEMANR